MKRQKAYISVMAKTTLIIISCFLALIITSCSQSGSGELYSNNDYSKWKTTGDVSIKDDAFTLNGAGAQAVLKSGKYQNFELSMDLRTTTGGKGAVFFHTDALLTKGYRIAINNDLTDAIWWRLTGSLMSVRNITKNFVRENDWFTMKICVYGPSVTVFINGQMVVDYIQPKEPYRVAPNENVLLSNGTFALVSEGIGAIQFRNISVMVPENVDITTLAEGVDEQADDIIRLHQEDFPVLDYHVHLKGGLTKEVAAKQSRLTGINYAIAPNCGIGFPITNDEEIAAFIKLMRSEPFILAMQAEGREWLTTFSQEARDKFDYVFTDALTFRDNKDRRTRLWIKSETWIEDEQKYMDLIVDKICDVLQEPMDIYVNPCYLPDQMSDRYDEFWTEERMNKFVGALAKSGKALEINELYNIPNKAIILKAKAAGVKFTFGTNNVIPEVSMLEYSIRMKKECGLTAKDMYRPRLKN